MSDAAPVAVKHRSLTSSSLPSPESPKADIWTQPLSPRLLSRHQLSPAADPPPTLSSPADDKVTVSPFLDDKDIFGSQVDDLHNSDGNVIAAPANNITRRNDEHQSLSPAVSLPPSATPSIVPSQHLSPHSAAPTSAVLEHHALAAATVDPPPMGMSESSPQDVSYYPTATVTTSNDSNVIAAHPSSLTLPPATDPMTTTSPVVSPPPRIIGVPLPSNPGTTLLPPSITDRAITCDPTTGTYYVVGDQNDHNVVDILEFRISKLVNSLGADPCISPSLRDGISNLYSLRVERSRVLTMATQLTGHLTEASTLYHALSDREDKLSTENKAISSSSEENKQWLEWSKEEMINLTKQIAFHLQQIEMVGIMDKEKEVEHHLCVAKQEMDSCTANGIAFQAMLDAMQKLIQDLTIRADALLKQIMDEIERLEKLTASQEATIQEHSKTLTATVSELGQLKLDIIHVRTINRLLDERDRERVEWDLLKSSLVSIRDQTRADALLVRNQLAIQEVEVQERPPPEIIEEIKHLRKARDGLNDRARYLSERLDLVTPAVQNASIQHDDTIEKVNKVRQTKQQLMEMEAEVDALRKKAEEIRSSMASFQQHVV